MRTGVTTSVCTHARTCLSKAIRKYIVASVQICRHAAAVCPGIHQTAAGRARDRHTQVERKIDTVARRTRPTPATMAARLFMRERIQFISRAQTCVCAFRGENVIVPVRRVCSVGKTNCQVAAAVDRITR